jgi:hypothetical protein
MAEAVYLKRLKNDCLECLNNLATRRMFGEA